MKNSEDIIYGIRIVPFQDESGLIFGGFEGIVISSPDFCGDDIEILRLVREGNSYHIDSWTKVPFEETLAHTTSGKAKAEFLLSKAREFAKENEEIAFCSKVSCNFLLLDATWDSFKEAMQERGLWEEDLERTGAKG